MRAYNCFVAPIHIHEWVAQPTRNWVEVHRCGRTGRARNRILNGCRLHPLRSKGRSLHQFGKAGDTLPCTGARLAVGSRPVCIWPRGRRSGLDDNVCMQARLAYLDIWHPRPIPSYLIYHRERTYGRFIAYLPLSFLQTRTHTPGKQKLLTSQARMPSCGEGNSGSGGSERLDCICWPSTTCGASDVSRPLVGEGANKIRC